MIEWRGRARPLNHPDAAGKSPAPTCARAAGLGSTGRETEARPAGPWRREGRGREAEPAVPGARTPGGRSEVLPGPAGPHRLLHLGGHPGERGAGVGLGAGAAADLPASVPVPGRGRIAGGVGAFSWLGARAWAGH